MAAGQTQEWNPRLALDRLAATVIVSAQAEPLLAENVSAPADVFTREQMDERQQVWLGTMLTAAPGAALSRLGRSGGVSTFFLAGGNSNFTKVLVDGVAVNEPGGAFDFSNFTLDNVEKVELTHGASSALFGSDALAGVVQVFTRRGATRIPALELLGEGGTFATGRGAVQLSGLLGRFDYSAAAGRFQTDGQGANDDFRNTTLSGNFGWRFSETNRLRLAVRSATSDAGAQGQIAFEPPDLDHHNAFRNFSAGLGWEFAAGPRWQHRIAASESYTRQIFQDPSSDFCFPTPPFLCDFAFTARNQFNRAGFTAQSSYVVARGGVTFGYQNEVENGFFSGEHGRRNNQGGYVEGRWLPLPRLTLVAGVRVEANDSFGTRAVPRAGVTYTTRVGRDFWGSTRLRFSYGEGIKEPSLAQSFAQDQCFPGNAALRPERNRSFGFGAEQLLAGDRVRVSTDAFFNRFYDMVSFAFGQFPGTPPTPSSCPFGFGSFFNTDLARARGVNTGVEAQATRWLRLSGHYSFVDSRVLISPNAFDPSLVAGNRLLRRPVHSGTFILNADFRRMNWNLASYFSGPRTDSDFLGLGFTSNPGYARFDLAMHYNLRHGLTAFGRIENLFDKQYQETLGFPAYRRHFLLGMKMILGGE